MTALKTISMYLRSADTELEEAGESTEGMAESVSKLRQEILGLTDGRVEIQVDEDTFKSSYEIIGDISKVWDDITDIDQAALLELIGGKRNANITSALIENFEIAEDVIETTGESANSALEENEKYLDSIAGKLSKFNSSFQAFSATAIDSESVKNVVDVGTGAIDTLTVLVDILGTIPILIGTITGAITAYKSATTGSALFGLTSDDMGDVALTNILSQDKAIKDLQKTISGYNNISIDATKSTGDYINEVGKSNSLLASYLKTVDGNTASMKGFSKYAKDAGMDVQTLGAKAKIAQVGVNLLNFAVSSFISLGISFAISKIVEGLISMSQASQDAIDASREMVDNFKELEQATDDNLDTLKSLESEFKTLSSGVNEYGENVALTADEYERYKSIVSEIVGISPELAEGYSLENGYIADKNGLLEKAIELQEAEYQQELKRLALTDNLVTVFKGYNEEYKKFSSQSDGSNIEEAFGAVYGSANDSSGAKVVKDVLGISDDTYQSYMLSDNLTISPQFWSDYSSQIISNAESIWSQIENSGGLDWINKGEESLYKQMFLDTFESIRIAQGDMNDVTAKTTDYLIDVVASSHEEYQNASSEMQGVVDSYIANTFTPADVDTTDEINIVKNNIATFISEAYKYQSQLAGIFDLSNMFKTGDVSVSKFRGDVNSLLSELRLLGASDDFIVAIKTELDIDNVEEQLSTLKAEVTGYTDELDNMTREELVIAYRIINAEGSMHIDVLEEKMENAIYLAGEMVDVFNFEPLETGLSAIASDISSVVSAMEKLASGTVLTKQELADLAFQYPELLKQSDLFIDGSIQGQKALLDYILVSQENAYDAQLDAKIAELKATEQVINDQLAMETEKAQLLLTIKNETVNGVVMQESELLDRISEYNDLQGQNYVTMEQGKLVVNENALNTKLNNESEYASEGTGNIWEPYANNIIGAHSSAFTAVDRGFAANSNTMYQQLFNTNLPYLQSYSEAVSAAMQGALDNASAVSLGMQAAMAGINSPLDLGLGPISDDYYASIMGGAGFGGVNLDFQDYSGQISSQPLDEWISQQQAANDARIEALDKMKLETINAYKNLEALKDLDLFEIYSTDHDGDGYGDWGIGKDGEFGVPEDDGSDSSDEDSDKTIEEYIADIDKFYEAQKRLEEAQRARQKLMKEYENETDQIERVKMSKDLIDAYHEEMDAEQALMDLKNQAIEANANVLRNLGFEVEHNPATNEFLIKNLEHLNSLTADSAGEYETLQEATNALRKETEDLIDATEQLNDDNIAAEGTLQDLGYEITEIKRSIIDLVEDTYEKQAEAYQKIIDLKKELIETTKEEYDYEQDIADKVKEIADLQARIDQLSLDDSREADAERNSLIEELEEAQKDLNQTQQDNAVDEQLNSLDNMEEDYITRNEEELELLRETLNDSEEMWDIFYKTIMGQTVDIGSSIDSSIAEAWIRAGDAVIRYNSAVGTSSYGTSTASIPKYHSGGVVGEGAYNQKEVLALLEKGEIVIDDGKQAALYKIIDFQEQLSLKLGETVGNISGVSGAGKQGNNLKPDEFATLMDNSSIDFRPEINVTIEHNGDLSNNDAESFGSQIADVAIGKLYDAFGRKGINSTRAMKLKP